MSWPPFDDTDALDNPFEQFETWFDAARGLVRDLDAVALATTSASGQPSVRMVLLRYRGPTSYGFYTNYESHKGLDLAANPRAAILWYVEALGRQVRIEGRVERMSAERSDEYFTQRPRGHQVGAHASNQSRVLSSRGELETRLVDVDARFRDTEIPRPDHWGGYEVFPERFEFWQMREDRLHDRVQYLADPSGVWRRHRLAP